MKERTKSFKSRAYFLLPLILFGCGFKANERNAPAQSIEKAATQTNLPQIPLKKITQQTSFGKTTLFFYNSEELNGLKEKLVRIGDGQLWIDETSYTGTEMGPPLKYVSSRPDVENFTVYLYSADENEAVLITAFSASAAKKMMDKNLSTAFQNFQYKEKYICTDFQPNDEANNPLNPNTFAFQYTCKIDTELCNSSAMPSILLPIERLEKNKLLHCAHSEWRMGSAVVPKTTEVKSFKLTPDSQLKSVQIRSTRLGEPDLQTVEINSETMDFAL